MAGCEVHVSEFVLHSTVHSKARKGRLHLVAPSSSWEEREVGTAERCGGSDQVQTVLGHPTQHVQQLAESVQWEEVYKHDTGQGGATAIVCGSSGLGQVRKNIVLLIYMCIMYLQSECDLSDSVPSIFLSISSFVCMGFLMI